jgi:hypothetical protein
VHNGVNQPPNELVRMRILHETGEYLDADQQAHQRDHHMRTHGCERHPDGHPNCWHTATPDELRELGKAIMLAPNLNVCEALLRGETVPLSKLDRNWLTRLGRK